MVTGRLRIPPRFFIWPVACKSPRADTPLMGENAKGASMRNVVCRRQLVCRDRVFDRRHGRQGSRCAIKARGSLVCGVGTRHGGLP